MMMTFAKIQAFFTTRTAIALLLGWVAYHYVNAGMRQAIPAKFVVAGILAVIASGLLLRRRWAVYAAIAAILVLALNSVLKLDLNHLTLWDPVRIIAMCVSGWWLWKHPEERWLGGSDMPPPGSEEDDAEKPMISLVLLRSRPRYLEANWLATLLSDVWDIKLASDKDAPDADGFVAGEHPPFHIFITKPVFGMFVLHNVDQPYFDDPEEAARQVGNLRVVEVISNHQSWLSLDFIRSSNDQLPEQAAYQLIGKAIAALADDETLALMAPGYRYFNFWSSNLEEQLTGPDPLSVFREEVKAPVIGVPDGDSIEQAIAEARRRWPEFVSAFQDRPPDDKRFIVKAPFTSEDGDTEHMWLEVFGLEPEYVHGHLMNEPFHNKKLKKGSQVEVPVSEISDWLCPDDQGNAKGNFTANIVSKAATPQNAE